MNGDNSKESLQSSVGSRQQNRKRNFSIPAGGLCSMFFCKLPTSLYLESIDT